MCDNLSKIIILCFSILSISACTYEWEVNPVKRDGRTILVYLAGDNNLSSEVEDKKRALLDGWNPDLMGGLIIFSDSYGKNPPLLLAARRDRNGKTVTDTLRRYSNTNSASAELMREVIDDTRKLSPANSYGFIIFSHATGWLPPGAFINPKGWGETRSVIVDGNREMAFADFVSAIPDDAFDFMIFDMCFMAGVETTYALRSKTKYIVASAAELLSPGFTPIYRSSLALLYKREADLVTFADIFFNRVDGLDGYYRSATVSVVSTSGMAKLSMISKEVFSAGKSQYLDIQYYDRGDNAHVFFDFADYMQRIATPEQYARIESCLAESIMMRRNTKRLINIDIRKHSGLSIYIPQPSLSWLNERYAETEWCRSVR